MSKAADYLDDIDELIDNAMDGARNAREQDFVSDMRDKYDDWGDEMFLSQAQYDWLKNLEQRTQ